MTKNLRGVGIAALLVLLSMHEAALSQDRPSTFPACIGDSAAVNGCDPMLPNLRCSFVLQHPTDVSAAAGAEFCQAAGYFTGYFWPMQNRPGGQCGVTTGNVVCHD